MNVFRGKIIFQIFIVTIPILINFIFIYCNIKALNGIKNILIKKYFPDTTTDVENIIASLKLNEGIITFIISIVLSFLLLVKIRARNEDKCVNKGNKYIDCCYAYFYIAAKILNYSKINLTRIPIWLQYNIILADTFEEITYNDDLDIDSNGASIEIFENNKDYTKVNLIIEDTYTISNEQIPESNRNFPLIKISRSYIDGRIRKYNKNLVDLVIKTVYEYENNLSELNIYATTNTKHNFEIAQKCFKVANRSSTYVLKIYQQSSIEKRNFSTSHTITK